MAAAVAMLLMATSTYAQTPATPSPPAPATPPSPVPGLQVAAVTMPDALRTSKIVGSSVTNEQNQTVGTVDDLLSKSDHIVLAVISVGGFLGIGSKLVAVPYADLQIDKSDKNLKVLMHNASKEALTAFPAFTYQ